MAGVCAAAGLALSFRLTAVHVMMAAVAAALLYAYVAYLRRLSPVGPLLVAVAAAMALVYGGAAAGAPGPATLGAVYVFLLAFALVALDDREMRPLTTAAAALAVALAPLPYLFLGYGGLFLLLMFLAAGLLLSAVRKLYAPEAGVVPPADLVRAALVVGLAAFSFAGVTG
jgi:4-hydroxybenzoate polyprenyltransferase